MLNKNPPAEMIGPWQVKNHRNHSHGRLELPDVQGSPLHRPALEKHQASHRSLIKQPRNRAWYAKRRKQRNTPPPLL